MAQRGKTVIDPILELMKDAENDIRATGEQEDLRLADELRQQAQALADWVADVSEVIVDLTNDYLEKT